jgi:hypothetical protein
MSPVEILAYRVSGDRLIRVATEQWEAFCRGALPLETDDPRDGRLNVLLLKLRGVECEVVEPVALDVDEHGYIKRVHVAFDPLPSTRVLDARSAFLGRYLRHTYRWDPSSGLIARALASANATPCGESEAPKRDSI